MARSVIGLVLGYVTSLVVDLAILIEVCFMFYLLMNGNHNNTFFPSSKIVALLLCNVGVDAGKGGGRVA